MRYGIVVPLVTARALSSREFTYELPNGAGKGAVVSVPFGRSRARGVVIEVVDAPPAGVQALPIERVRRFEGPVLAERTYRAQEAQGASIRHPGDSGPGRRLGEVLAERFSDLGADMEEAQWDSRKRPDSSWQVSLVFTADGLPRLAEWVFDPRSRHVSPANDTAAGLCLPDVGRIAHHFAIVGFL